MSLIICSKNKYVREVEAFGKHGLQRHRNGVRPESRQGSARWSGVGAGRFRQIGLLDRLETIPGTYVDEI